MRKSPIRHHVRQYKKHSGTTVHNYERGHGNRLQKTADLRLKCQKAHNQATLGFSVQINYSAQSSEHINLNSSTYPQAIETAMLARINITPPVSIEVTKA